MVIEEHIVIGRKLYEPNILLHGLNVYKVTHVHLPMVDFEPLEARKNKGAGEAGFATHIDNLRDMYISKEEAMHSLVLMMQEEMERNFPHMEFDFLVKVRA